MQQLIGLLGFIAVLQMIFIPGYLVLRAFRLQLPILRGILAAFALSFLANYIIVMLLTLLHLYTPAVMWGIVAVEWVALISLLWPAQNGWGAWRKQAELCRDFWQTLNRGEALDRFIRIGLLFAGIFIILGFVENFVNQLGEIFTAWDPVMSYNFWAEQWANNQFPQYTWHYPQLIPANWSMTYVLTAPASMGTDLEFFAKAVMPLFPLMLLLSLFDLAIETRRTGYLLAVVFTAYLLYRFAESFGQGWVDVPMTFFAFLSLSLLFLAGKSERPRSYILLSSLICAASAVTKQAGLYIVVWYPVLCYILALRPQSKSGFKNISSVIWSWLLILAISLPWYIVIQYQIDHGLLSSEVGFVTSDIYQALGFGWGLRIAFGIFQAGLLFWIMLGIALVYSRYRSSWRILIFPITVYTVLWIAFYSYALRNFTLVAPLLGLMAGLGVEKLYTEGILKRFFKRITAYLCVHDYKPLHVILGLSIAVAVITQIPQCSSPVLVQDQIAAQQSLGSSDLNWMLFRYQALHGFQGKIMTSWDYLGHVPGLSQYYQPYRPFSVEANPYQSSWMVNPKDLQGILRAYPSSYILVANEGGLTSKAYLSYFKKLEKEKVLKAVVILPKFTLYKIEKKPVPLP